MTMDRPTLHDPGTATREELVEHVKDQRRFIKFLEGQISDHEDLIRRLKAGEIPGVPKPSFDGGIGDIMDGFFGKGGKP